MRFSRSLKSSAQSLPSPNGVHIATILSSSLSLRETRSLEITRVIALPPELAASVMWFLWSSSSQRVLVASADNIRVYSTTDTQFSAIIKNPTSGTTKVSFVTFGSIDDEVCVFSEFGLKLTVFNLSNSKSVDISSPKLYHPGTASKGFSRRPGTSNLALLTRSGGKDVVSIHARENLGVLRSWFSETVDAQGLGWSPDGRWLAVWESASQGHRLVIYTADGHLYKTWNGPTSISDEDKDISLGPGVKLFDWSQTGAHVAISDYSGIVTVLSVPSFKESMKLLHTTAVKPAETLQIWLEQVAQSPTGGFDREFVQATQTTCPPTSGTSPISDTSAKTGTNFISFDKSGTLLATRVDHMPTAIWIWDIATSILRAVMIMYAPIAKATWHPSINELLMIRCEGEESRGLVQLWDPSWKGPKIIDFGRQVPGGKVIGKSIARWVNVEGSWPTIFFSDTHDCVLAAVSELEDEGDVPWVDAEIRGLDIYGQREESPLNLVAADEKRPNGRRTEDALLDGEEGMTKLSAGSDEVDDTFRFRRFVDP